MLTLFRLVQKRPKSVDGVTAFFKDEAQGNATLADENRPEYKNAIIFYQILRRPKPKECSREDVPL